MKLKGFSYKERNWQLTGIDFTILNLIVGKSTAGKSKTLRSLYNVANIIKGCIEKDYDNVEALLEFEDDDATIEFSFKIVDGIVINENLTKNGDVVISRNDEITLLYNEQIQPPIDKLVVNVRVDEKEYPLIYKLSVWANALEFIGFNKIDDSWKNGRLVKMLNTISDAQKQSISDTLAEVLDYDINEIKIEDKAIFKIVSVKEKGIDGYLPVETLSTGLFRTLTILVYMEYLRTKNNNGTILIDDFCEGLDYNHSTKLGKEIYRLCDEMDIQLITASNDSFLMDVVPLKYWNILIRNGNVVESYNQSKNYGMFEEFMYTGLSNFDLLASNFIYNYTTQKQ